MSVLDDARQLLAREYDLFRYESSDLSGAYCGLCEMSDYGYDSDHHYKLSHADDCPWLQLPAIVRALEAAEAVILRERDEDGQFLLGGRGIEVWVPEAPYRALEDALSGAAGGGEGHSD